MKTAEDLYNAIKKYIENNEEIVNLYGENELVITWKDITGIYSTL